MYSWCRVAGNVLYQTYLLDYQICSGQPGRSGVGPALYIFSLLCKDGLLGSAWGEGLIYIRCLFATVPISRINAYAQTGLMV